VIDIPLHCEPNDGMLTVDVLRKCHCMLVIVNILVSPARNNFPGGSACCASKTNWHLATRNQPLCWETQKPAVLYIQKVFFQLLLYFFVSHLFRCHTVISHIFCTRGYVLDLPRSDS